MTPERAYDHLRWQVLRFVDQDTDAQRWGAWPDPDPDWDVPDCAEMSDRLAVFLRGEGIDAASVHLNLDGVWSHLDPARFTRHAVCVVHVDDVMRFAVDLTGRQFHDALPGGRGLFDVAQYPHPLLWELWPGWHGEHPLLGAVFRIALPW